MYRNRFFNILIAACRVHRRTVTTKIRNYAPVTLGFLTTAWCDDKQKEINAIWDEARLGSLEHEFLIRQATTVNVNAATQLLTVTLVAIQDTSERLYGLCRKISHCCCRNILFIWEHCGV